MTDQIDCESLQYTGPATPSVIEDGTIERLAHMGIADVPVEDHELWDDAGDQVKIVCGFMAEEGATREYIVSRFEEPLPPGCAETAELFSFVVSHIDAILESLVHRGTLVRRTRAGTYSEAVYYRKYMTIKAIEQVTIVCGWTGTKDKEDFEATKQYIVKTFKEADHPMPDCTREMFDWVVDHIDDVLETMVANKILVCNKTGTYTVTIGHRC
jgi:hypothetical protein